MKPILYFLLLIATLFCVSNNASAGFFIKKTVVANETNQLPAGKQFISIVSPSKQPSKAMQFYRSYNQKEWYGIASMLAAVLGLLIPGVNLLAILFGAMGMGRRCRAQGLAVAGFAIGMLELLLYLLTSSTLVALILF